MAWFFGDGFDTYQQLSDAYAGGSYWDSSTQAGLALSSSGRFTGSRGLTSVSGLTPTSAVLVKSSGQNDAVHHVNVAYYQSEAISGTNNEFWFTLSDGTTAQCSVVFRSDGAILLTSGIETGTTLATYSGAVAAATTWYSFEFEVVINNTTGSFKVRKNGNTSDDSSTTGLNTRASANNYANKLTIGNARSSPGAYTIDDLLWRSDPSSVAWAGDVRCNTRLPASDAAVTWTRSGSTVPVTPYVGSTAGGSSANTARYNPFYAACSGTITSAIVVLGSGYTGTGNLKVGIFTDNAGAPGTSLGSATVATITQGNNTATFGSPPSVTQGTKYWLGVISDTGVGSGWTLTASVGTGAYANSAGTASGNAPSYASFPTNNPTITGTAAQANIFTVNITPTTAANANLVADPTQDGAGGYVYDSTPGDTDLYAVQAISGTPTTILAVTTRMLAQKSDAGTRTAAVVLKSGATTSAGSTVALNTSFAYIFRTDTVDPNTSAAWTATAVNNLQVGMKVVA